MREISYKPLSLAAFEKYGRYANLLNPTAVKIGQAPIEFYRDMIQFDLGSGLPASFSVCRVLKRPFVVDFTEYHDFCPEGILPLDGDVLLHVAPADPGKDFPSDQAEIFKVPQGTLVVLRPGVWHHAPFALSREMVNCIILLSERTYKNDCKGFELQEERRLKVRGDGI